MMGSKRNEDDSKLRNLPMLEEAEKQLKNSETARKVITVFSPVLKKFDIDVQKIATPLENIKKEVR